jgi:hypothetical protein
VGLTFIAIVLLVAAWAALLLPDFRNRSRGTRRRDSIASFSQQLNLLERARPGARPSARVVAFPQRAGSPNAQLRAVRSPHAPRNAAQARARRVRVLVALAAASVVTLLGAIVLGPLLLAAHLLVDIVLAAYVWLLVQHNKRLLAARAERRGATAAPEAEVRPIRRTASGS